MNGKINIIFGFFFLALTAVLGPAFLVPQLGAKGAMMNETAQLVEEVKGAAVDENLEAKQSKAITGLFILGAVFHSGMLYLGMVFGQSWAFKLLLVGEISLLAGLVLMGVAAVIGIKKPSQV